MRRSSCLFFSALVALSTSAFADELISIRGAAVAAEAVTAAAAQIKKSAGLDFRVLTDGGSGGAVAAVAEEVADVALLSRKITPHEHALWPEKEFTEARFGMQALLIVVPSRVWDSGVHAITREQFRDIYSGRTKNWKALGGEDRKIVFFNRDVRTSAWELLMVFLYEDARKAPPSDGEVLTDASDVTTAVEFNGGSISVLEYGAPRPAGIQALALRRDDGSIAEPTPADIASGRYNFARPLVLATARKPSGKVRRFVEFMLSDEGQAYVKKSAHLTNANLAEKK